MDALLSLMSLLLPGQIQVETRTLLTGPKGAESTDTLLFERIAAGKTFLRLSKTLSSKGDVSYSTSEFRMDGTPLRTRQEGFWNDRWNVFATEFLKGGANQSINDVVTKSKEKPEAFRDPTQLWFWRTHPKVGESVTVNFLAQNTIATFKIKFTYEGDEKMKLAGREVKLHRVREDPLGARGVFTIWWYDDQGMGVKRYHKTTTNEYSFDLLSWR